MKKEHCTLAKLRFQDFLVYFLKRSKRKECHKRHLVLVIASLLKVYKNKILGTFSYTSNKTCVYVLTLEGIK